jgi:Flp pilus assembly protein TadG
MKRARLPRRRLERGTAAVEFALVFPVFLLMVLGTIDFGYFFFVSEIVANAAREGARAGSVVDWQAGNAAAIGAAEMTANSYLTHGGLKATGVASAITAVNGIESVEVSINYPVGSITGFLTTIMPAHAQATAVMRWQ